ncbi:hypothetical protein ACFO9Q_17610 [Paenibacillus sp. GCM10023252]|uniref:hypothetical protein n=1 Tax=Paenibacillus sp. GCM10023252 TaxID=3252649 RepID=UPI00360C8E1F
MASYHFAWNERLRISIPVLDSEWDRYSMADRQNIIEQWESIRGTIPNHVMAFERIINLKLAELSEEDNFERSCLINAEIAEYASRINDLHIWYRMNQEVESRLHA